MARKLTVESRNLVDDVKKVEIELPTEFDPAEFTNRKPHQVSVSELISACNQAVERMGNNNPNRYLLVNCAFAMRQLVDRLAKLEDRQKVN